jgi:peptidyl-tRNA hydrolase, PTH1 family
MALFQRQPQVTTNQFYTLGNHITLLIVGLGNPGAKYNGTRHNIGFACLDDFASVNEFETWSLKKNLKCHLTLRNLGSASVILVKPTTYMNLSGQAVKAVKDFYKIAPEHILVVHDELAIPFGQVRIRPGGSSAGHNGVQSIIDQLGEDFGRIRIGIHSEATDKEDSATFVLKKFDKTEKAQLPALQKEVSAILSEYCFGNGELNPETRSFVI